MVLVTALWVGGLFWVGLVFAPYLFTLASQGDPAVPHSGVAAELIGPLLYSSDVTGMIVGAALLVGLFLLRKRNQIPLGGRFFVSEIVVAVAIMCAAVNYWGLTPRLNRLQNELADRYGGFHLADPADSQLTQFSWLHEVSAGVFMTTFVAALVGLICMTQFWPRVAKAPQ
jgi:hypothetical protein